MVAMTVGELKANFSEVLERVQAGETFKVLYGRSHKPVAMLVPFENNVPARRPIGIYDGKFSIEFSEDFKFKSYEEFLGI
jgi:antitoxin (DNA-binding transcriptional repressor) of toxin-antitoxin stability system